MLVSGDGLGHQFPGTGPLFTGLSFAFRAGDLVGITGPSGSGKSTLLSIVAGWEKPTQGTLTMEGVQSIGWVFQNPYGVPRRTALDHAVLPLLAKGIPRSQALRDATEILESFGLGRVADREFCQLSGGEAQRLMLARAVAKRPNVLLVDEPTAQLDPIATHTVNEVLGSLATDNMIVLVATHDPQTAAACALVVELGEYA